MSESGHKVHFKASYHFWGKGTGIQMWIWCLFKNKQTDKQTSNKQWFDFLFLFACFLLLSFCFCFLFSLFVFVHLFKVSETAKVRKRAQGCVLITWVENKYSFELGKLVKIVNKYLAFIYHVYLTCVTTAFVCLCELNVSQLNIIYTLYGLRVLLYTNWDKISWKKKWTSTLTNTVFS